MDDPIALQLTLVADEGPEDRRGGSGYAPRVPIDFIQDFQGDVYLIVKGEAYRFRTGNGGGRNPDVTMALAYALRWLEKVLDGSGIKDDGIDTDVDRIRRINTEAERLELIR